MLEHYFLEHLRLDQLSVIQGANFTFKYLVWSNIVGFQFWGRLLEQSFGRHSAAFPSRDCPEDIQSDSMPCMDVISYWRHLLDTPEPAPHRTPPRIPPFSVRLSGRSPKHVGPRLNFGVDRSFCVISRKFLEISASEEHFSDSGKLPFHTLPIHTPTKCRPTNGCIPWSEANNSGEIPQNWELQIFCFEEFLGGGHGHPHSLGYACTLFRETQEGCGGLRGENPGAFPKAELIFQQPCSLPESAQTLAGNSISCCQKIGEKLFQQYRNLPENPPSKEFRTATAFSSFLI